MVVWLQLFASLLSTLIWHAQFVRCWNQWDYKTTWSLQGPDSDDAINQEAVWRLQWDTAEQRYSGKYGPPRPRRGHSLHIVQTDARSDYQGETYIILFGGRDNDQQQEHIPRTYDVDTLEDGNIIFTTYDQKPVNPCNDPNHTYYSIEESVGCDFGNSSTAGIIDVGMIYNDVWAVQCIFIYSFYPRQKSTANRHSRFLFCHTQKHCVVHLGCTAP
jgi:hypothetical protein